MGTGLCCSAHVAAGCQWKGGGVRTATRQDVGLPHGDSADCRNGGEREDLPHKAAVIQSALQVWQGRAPGQSVASESEGREGPGGDHSAECPNVVGNGPMWAELMQ